MPSFIFSTLPIALLLLTLTQRVSSVRDEQLQAFIEPERSGQMRSSSS